MPREMIEELRAELTTLREQSHRWRNARASIKRAGDRTGAEIFTKIGKSTRSRNARSGLSALR